MKQKNQFSLFQALQTKLPPTLITLEEVYRLVTADANLKENTGKYRYYKSQGFEKDAVSIEQLETFISSVADIRFNVITRMNEIRRKDHPDKGYAHLTDKDECTLWRIFCK